jgi:hypothetical protein
MDLDIMPLVLILMILKRAVRILFLPLLERGEKKASFLFSKIQSEI